ncbi:MAG: InlB B-repeat-containing protein, partial [Bacillota bacterium]
TETSLYKGSAIFLEDVVLTAEFKAIDYVITVTASDGVEFSVASTAQIDESVEITYDLEAGYTLKSLSVSGGGQEIDVNDGSFIMPASDVSINIEADLYKISYKMEYYSSGSTYDFYYGEEISLVLNVDNMIFLGWFLDADFTEPMPQTAIGEEGETISVYPYFVEQYYTVTYVMADILMYYEDAIITYPADAIAETTVEYSDVFTADAPEETYEGNTFVGWYLDDLYETIAEEITIYENITLYAKYELETYTITYYYDEENSSVYTEEVAYLSALTPPETTDTDYYIFEEWIGDTTQLATADSVFFALYQQLYDNYYYCGDTLLGIVVGELSVVPEGDIDECECEGQTLTGFSLVYVSGTMAAYSAEHTANTYGIYYTNSTGATMSGSVFAQYEDTVYISYTLVTGYTFYMITSDEVELTLDDDGIYYYFIMPASDVYITIVTNKVTTTTTVTDTSSLTSSTISGQYSIRNNLEEEEVYIALSEGSVSEEQLATFILSLGTNTTTALSISLDLYDTDYNAIEFPDSTNLGITVPISSDLDIDSCTFSVVKLNTFSNEIYECKVFTIDEQNYVSFTVSDGGLYSILYTTVEVEDFTLTNFDVLLLTVGTLLFVVLIVVVARFIFAKKEIKRLNKLHKNM